MRTPDSRISRHRQPWYGRALARYLVAQYKLDLFPYHDLIIYEIGAGNGTLMGDVLDYLAAHEPEIYARTKYRIIEISERLQGMQRGRAKGTTAADAGGGDGGAGRLGKEKAKRRGHEDRVEIINSSIFEWDRVVPEPCFFLAMEVLVRLLPFRSTSRRPFATDSFFFGAGAQDNLSHDVVRYTTDTYEPLQCVVSVDAAGDYTELYEPVSDPLLARYLSLRSRLPSSRARSHPSRAIPALLAKFPVLRRLYATIPFAPNLTRPEFVPTRQLELLEILRDKFPNHRLLMSDFETLPDAIEGFNAPVVQTRYAGEVGSVCVGEVWGDRELTFFSGPAATPDCPVHDLLGPAGFFRHLFPDRLSHHGRDVLARHGQRPWGRRRPRRLLFFPLPTPRQHRDRLGRRECRRKTKSVGGD